MLVLFVFIPKTLNFNTSNLSFKSVKQSKKRFVYCRSIKITSRRRPKAPISYVEVENIGLAVFTQLIFVKAVINVNVFDGANFRSKIKSNIMAAHSRHIFPRVSRFSGTSCLPYSSTGVLRNWTCSQLKQPTISKTFTRSYYEVHGITI